MSWVTSLARNEIVNLKSYDHAAWEVGLERLHANELPWRTAGDMSEAGLNRYPEPQPQELIGRLAALYGVAPANLLADVFESLVGAVYIDGGLDPAKEFILKYLIPEIEEVAEGDHAGNFKSLLQQIAQREFNETPMYELLDEKGPDHSKCFKVAARIGRYHYAAAWGRTKKEAEQKAAMNALAQIHDDPVPFQAD